MNLLFLCTGNYYRSRVAEIYFNHHAAQLLIPWKAASRGLARTFSPGNAGPMSELAVKTLEMWGVPIHEQDRERYPIRVEPSDFPEYERIIAVSATEHYPMVETHFENYLPRVEFLEIGDLHVEPATTAMPRLKEELDVLLQELIGPFD